MPFVISSQLTVSFTTLKNPVLMSSHPLTNFFFHNIITEKFLQAQLAHLSETNHIKYVKSSPCSIDKSKDTRYWGSSTKLSIPMKNNNTAHDGFLIKTPLSQLNPSSTTADTLFSGCVTVEAGSANPRCNFLSFDNHNYINLSIAALSTSHYCLHSMDKDHCTKGISAANVKV